MDTENGYYLNTSVHVNQVVLSVLLQLFLALIAVIVRMLLNKNKRTYIFKLESNNKSICYMNRHTQAWSVLNWITCHLQVLFYTRYTRAAPGKLNLQFFLLLI